jgi:hypothetical protein
MKEKRSYVANTKLFTDSSRTDDNYSYSMEKLLQQ